jgi:hypothetical protein
MPVPALTPERFLLDSAFVAEIISLSDCTSTDKDDDLDIGVHLQRKAPRLARSFRRSKRACCPSPFRDGLSLVEGPGSIIGTLSS